MNHKSGKAKEAEIKNKWLKAIKEEGSIKRIDLIEKLGITFRHYEGLSTYIQEQFEELVEYNRSNKRWYWIGKVKNELTEEEKQKLV